VKAKTYEATHATRLVNRIFHAMTRVGIGASDRRILSVRGRRSGIERSTPVDAIRVEGDRWLVAGYGPVSWVGNVRAAGEVALGRGGRREFSRAVEPEPAEAVRCFANTCDASG
jgi:deazaflavin-dependent oxidoreductase (nitroreductase family)